MGYQGNSFTFLFKRGTTEFSSNLYKNFLFSMYQGIPYYEVANQNLLVFFYIQYKEKEIQWTTAFSSPDLTTFRI